MTINTDGAGLLNVVARNGNTFSVTATFTNDDTTPISLVGASIFLNIKQGSVSQDLSSDISISGGGNNIITIISVITLPKGVYNYTLTIQFSTGVITTFLYGTYTVNGL